MTTRRLVIAVNEQGVRVGESHHNAKLTDHEIELVHRLHDEGLGYLAIARRFDVSKSCIAGIVRCERRAQTPARWKTLEVRC